MDTQQIIDALKQQRERLNRAIAVLGGSSRTFSVPTLWASAGAPRCRFEGVPTAEWPTTVQLIEVTPQKKVVWALRD